MVNYTLYRSCAHWCLGLFLVLFGWQSLSAQAPHPCGTPSYKDPWLKRYQANPAAFPVVNPRNTTYIPLSFHVVGTDNGQGYTPLNSIFNAFCQLNEDYRNSGLQFFIEWPIRYIDNSDWISHDSVTIGAQMMFQNNIDSTINVYFVADPAGNCGYNLPYAGIAMNDGCLDGHTLAHEVGHNLRLPHTFLGWEGGVSWDGSVPPDYNNPAPSQVLYNYTFFQDSLYLDTLIIDTAFVEYVDRTGPLANCSTAADGFCDTPADYLAFRWNCDATNFSTQEQTDPNGTAFFSNGSNIMSYANDVCQSSFSPDQEAAMRSFVQSERQEMLYNQSPMNDSLLTNISPVSPINNAVVPENQVVFRWNSQPNATHYLVRTFSPFGGLLEEALVTDTSYASSLNYPPAVAGFGYTWQVRGLNQGNTCSPISNPQSFLTSPNTAVQDLEAGLSMQLYPNPLYAGQLLQVEVHSLRDWTAQVEILDARGRLLWQQQRVVQRGEQQLVVPTQSLAAGLYFLRLHNERGQVTQRFILQP